MSCTRAWLSQMELQVQAVAVQCCCAAGEHPGLTMHAVSMRMVPWQHRHCVVRVHQSACDHQGECMCARSKALSRLHAEQLREFALIALIPEVPCGHLGGVV